MRIFIQLVLMVVGWRFVVLVQYLLLLHLASPPLHSWWLVVVMAVGRYLCDCWLSWQ